MAQGLRVGSVTPRYFADLFLSPSSISANSVSHETFPTKGLFVDMALHISQPIRQTGLQVLGARVTATDVMEVDFWNTTGGALVPTALSEFQVIGY